MVHRRDTSKHANPLAELQASETLQFDSPTSEAATANSSFRQRMRDTLNHKIWRFSIVVCEIILLFGFELRDLACPKESDQIFDIGFSITFVMLIADILFMCFVVPGYFNLGRSDDSFCRIAFGSWSFWLDFFSSLTILNEITFVNTLRARSEVYDILLLNRYDQFRAVGIFQSNSRTSLSYFNMITNAARLPRVARLMQAPGFLWMLEWISQKIPQLGKCRSTLTDPSNSVTKGVKSIRLDSSPSQKSNDSDGKKMSERKINQMKNFLNARNAANVSVAVNKNIIQEDEPIVVLESDYSMHGGLEHYVFDYSSSGLYKQSRRSEKNSQVGQKMFDLTVRRVALALMIIVAVTSVCTPHQVNIYYPQSMIVLHESFSYVDNTEDRIKVLNFSFKEKERDQFLYLSFGDHIFINDEIATKRLRKRERTVINVCYGIEDFCDQNQPSTKVIINSKKKEKDRSIFSLSLILFFVILWYVGVASFAGPIHYLIIIPIERMIKLLNMMVKDTLGYESSDEYKRFVRNNLQEEKMSNWRHEILNGMETSFLMSTILRIGSLLKVGFGEAGAEIIRQSLYKSSIDLDLSFKRRSNQSGVNVSCIFLFCDIRSYTDITECLREEVFVFTNKIAEVVHSICHSFGGYANKNIGDAFLITWVLDEKKDQVRKRFSKGEPSISASKNQADKALLSVVHIIMALNYESFFLGRLSDVTRARLIKKLSNKEGSIVKMGFGLHAGRAVQGVLGSDSKIDATYISNAVEQVEYLESSTKRYGVKLLMSGEFHKLLQKRNQKMCRLIDRLVFLTEDTHLFEEMDPENFERMEIYTYDMDSDELMGGINSSLTSMELQNPNETQDKQSSRGSNSVLQMPFVWNTSKKATNSVVSTSLNKGRRMSIWNKSRTESGGVERYNTGAALIDVGLVLPNQRVAYNDSLWDSDDIKFIRKRYTETSFFHLFNQGLHAYFSCNWSEARSHFQSMKRQFNDPPSKYFLRKMNETKYNPPRGFKGWSVA